MRIKTLVAMALLAPVLTIATGCQSSNQVKGTAAGGAVGAGVGAVAGHNIKGISRTEGAVAGALVGGLLGNVMGRQSDRMNDQQAQINQQNQQMNSISQQANQTVVNVTNSNGSITPVVLNRVGNQWQGPRGEFYANLPGPEQLRGAYGF